jgi:hypothetical protein
VAEWTLRVEPLKRSRQIRPNHSRFVDIMTHTLDESRMELFELFLHLRIKKCRINSLDLQEFSHLLEKFGHEIGFYIRSDGSRATSVSVTKVRATVSASCR